MNIKTAILLVLVAIAITACVSMTEPKATAPETIVDQQPITQIEPTNETLPPGTVVKEIKSQIKFNVIPPPGMNESVAIN